LSIILEEESHMRISSFTALTIAGALLTLAPLSSASAYTLKTLHSFCNEANCGDGDTPRNGVLVDSSGNVFGTTEFGGKYNKGVVFKLIPNATRTKYTEHILYSLCKKAGCPFGAYPDSEPIMDVDGDLYLTTQGGGSHTDGAVIKMRPVSNGWVISVIHSFCAQPPDCPDGGVPASALTYAGKESGALWNESSPLFGTTNTGGTNNKGTAYELSPNGSGWTHQVLHNFNSPSESAYPSALLEDPSGNLFGVTYMGGNNGVGVLYKLAAGSWTETTLHNFCADANCTDGSGGFGRLAMDGAGNIFGTTLIGGSGANCPEPDGCGVAFERTAGGNYKVIYNFCAKTNCNDGNEPAAGLNIDGAGTLFGTTHLGGPATLGTVFTLTHGSNKWNNQVLYAFCSEQNCTDGAGPGSPVAFDGSGDVYGTTDEDGANGSGGTVYRLKP